MSCMLNMEMILLNYEDKQTVISYDIQNNFYYEIPKNIRRKGFYDKWQNEIFGVIVLNRAIWVFIEAEIFKLTDIFQIKNSIIEGNTQLLIETKLGNKYNLKTSSNLEFSYVFDSDYCADESEYNLGLYIEKLKNKKDLEALFINNVLVNGLNYGSM